MTLAEADPIISGRGKGEVPCVPLISGNRELTSKAGVRTSLRKLRHFFRHNRDLSYYHPKMERFINTRDSKEQLFHHSDIT